LRRLCRAVPQDMLDQVVVESKGKRVRVQYLYECRTYRGWSQRIAGKMAENTRQKTYSAWETGTTVWVPARPLRKLLRQFSLECLDES
jgi:hypothetical protein